MNQQYWQVEARQTAQITETDLEKGLTHSKAVELARKFGPNATAKKGSNWPSLLIRQFANALILILIAASIISIFIGDIVEAAIIIGIVLFSGVLGFANEYRSEKTLQELEKHISRKALVIREGQKIEIDVKHLVPGDIVLVAVGDIIPADLRIVAASEFSLNEAAITGESEPVEKSAAVDLKAKSFLEARNSAPAGAIVASGHATGIVVAIGTSTEFGRIASSIAEQKPETNFHKGVQGFGYTLIKITLALTALIFIVNTVFAGRPLLDSLLFALAIAVGITPELLPTIVTIGLANGARQMAKKHVIVKRLSAIEDLGNIDVLCTDKTGTLTEGSIALEAHLNASGENDSSVLEYALLCNSAIVGKKLSVAGNSIDVAIWKHALAKYGKHENDRPNSLNQLNEYKKISENTFDYSRRMMSVVVEQCNGMQLLIAKGAFDPILDRCTLIEEQGKIKPIGRQREELRKKFLAIANNGQRIIAVAWKQMQESAKQERKTESKRDSKEEYSEKDEQTLIFKGFIIFSDPPKKGAKEALQRLREANVDLKVLSGDNEFVVQKICQELGLQVKGVLLGTQIDAMDAVELAKKAEKTNVFARVTPEQKLRIMKALKHNGHVVGFLGDGVNDAPALHEADAGISVDSGVDVAKQAADIVLLRKDLHVLANGIEEGRTVFRNTTKYLLNTISANFGNMISLAASSAFLPFIPLLPAQILLNNLLSDAPMTTISTDKVDQEELLKPKKWNNKGIIRFMIYFGLLSSIFDIITMAFLIYVMGAKEAVFQTGWFLESLLSEVVIVFSLRTRRPFYKSKPSKILVGATAAVIAISLTLIYSPIGKWFGFAAPDGILLAVIAAIVLTYLALVEILKHWFFKKHEV